MHISNDIQSWFVIILIKKVKIAIVGSGLAGLTSAVNLVDAGHEVEIYESRSFWGGKVGVGKIKMVTI